MDFLCSTRSKRLAARSLTSRIASIICGFLFLTPLANVASAADPKTVVDTILGEEIATLQNQMVEMSSGCSGKGSGVPPVSWGALQVHENTAVNAFSAARTALATDKTPVAVQQINSGVSALDALISGLHDNCSGGPSGEDPLSYGKYVASRDKLKTELKTALRFL
jgi:hypothetical protein